MSESNIDNKIINTCRRLWKLSGEGKILLAVSGGADSVAMLSAFKMAGIPIETAHCNFNLRGAESIRDRDFVKNLCSNLGIPLHIAEFNTAREAEKGESVEMTCRRLRYDFFRRLMREGNFSRIAVAHNADDNIETFFLNFLRGCGSRGLKGMERDTGEIIRPLLDFSRKELIDFLALHSITYIVDSTNLESDYRRNFLRNEIFPLLESRWEGFRKAVASTIAIQNRENAIIEDAVKSALDNNDRLLPWPVLYKFADQETLVFHFIRPFGGTPSIAAEIAQSAAMKMPGKKWTLGRNHEAYFTREGILIAEIGESLKKKELTSEYHWKELKNSEALLARIQKSPLTEIYLPYEDSHYEWKCPTKEMKIKTLGMKGSQNVLKVLKDAGIPALYRKNFAILCDKSTGEPVWIPGIKRSRLHLVSAGMPKIYLCYKKALNPTIDSTIKSHN